VSSVNSFLAIINEWRAALKRLNELRVEIAKASEQSTGIDNEG